MLALLLSLAASCAPALTADQPPEERGAFVTLLGRDTVALESFARTPRRIEGDVVVRVPGTVLQHYVVDFDDAGAPKRSVLETKPLGTSAVGARRTTLEFGRDSVDVTIDSAGSRRRERHALAPNSVPTFMTGFGASYGLYTSLGLVEMLAPRLPVSPDTTLLPGVQLATGRSARRAFRRPTAAALDVDYFRMAWTRLTLDVDGRITSADASGTTEQTRSTRTAYFDVARAAAAFAARDRAGGGLGVASPNRIVRASVDGADVVISFGSPRRRGRQILGAVVPYDRVWRTGANEATVINADRDLVIGGTRIPAGAYSLWTVPARDGVTLVINRQVGQWGTEYDASRDVARVPMRTATLPTPQEDFTIDVAGVPGARELRVAWDTFRWSVSIAVP